MKNRKLLSDIHNPGQKTSQRNVGTSNTPHEPC